MCVSEYFHFKNEKTKAAIRKFEFLIATRMNFAGNVMDTFRWSHYSIMKNSRSGGSCSLSQVVMMG